MHGLSIGQRLDNVPIVTLERMLAKVLFPLTCLIVAAPAQTITQEQLRSSRRDTTSWLSYGRDLLGQRYVELNQINSKNVDRLRPAWVFATGGENRGLQATPLIHDGVLYLSADGSRVFAIDARTGAKIWESNVADASKGQRFSARRSLLLLCRGEASEIAAGCG